MKTAKQRHQERPDIFAPDGYEWEDAPPDIVASMDAAFANGPLSADFLPPPSELVFKANKKVTTMRLDADVLEWFQAMGKGYQTKINAVLRAYKAAHGKKAS
jgi:hypothetical protein